MRITLVTIRVPANPMYDSVTKRWIETYVKFKPKTEHELIVVDSDKAGDPGPFADHATRFVTYKGGGWDCGIWEYAGENFDTDLLICCNSSTYFWKDGWMERFVSEVEKNGVGLYGSMASLEYFPHLRTPCLVFQPEVIRRYPLLVNCREKTYAFECLAGKENFTMWCARNGYTPRLVTWDGCYEIADWRKPPNIFRRGDQSNILVKDRHVDTYEASSPEGKVALENMADHL